MSLRASKVSGGYGRALVCRDISFSLDKGETLFLLGPNGCGKSTLLRLLMGYLIPESGQVTLDGEDIRAMPRRRLAQLVAYIPQRHTPVFTYTVREVVTMGRASHFGVFQSPRQADHAQVTRALDRLGVLHLADKPFAQLSGGQQQMVLIARAMAQNAQILLMDEPTASLDYANTVRVLGLARTLAHEGYGMILSTHNPDHPFAYGDRALLMKHGEVVSWDTPEKALTGAHLQQVYGVEMDVITVTDRHGAAHRLCLPLGRGPA